MAQSGVIRDGVTVSSSREMSARCIVFQVIAVVS